MPYRLALSCWHFIAVLVVISQIIQVPVSNQGLGYFSDGREQRVLLCVAA